MMTKIPTSYGNLMNSNHNTCLNRVMTILHGIFPNISIFIIEATLLTCKCNIVLGFIQTVQQNVSAWVSYK